MHLSTEDYTKLTEAVLAAHFFAEVVRNIHDQGNFIDPRTGTVLAKGSPQLVAKFEEALAVLEQRCAQGLSVINPGKKTQ